jgi:hypothetical protein
VGDAGSQIWGGGGSGWVAVAVVGVAVAIGGSGSGWRGSGNRVAVWQCGSVSGKVTMVVRMWQWLRWQGGSNYVAVAQLQ